MCDIEVAEVAKVLWGSGFGKRRVGGDTFNISEPRLGMGGEGLLLHRWEYQKGVPRQIV